jgi:hypothetical protein
MEASQQRFKNSWSRIDRAKYHLAAFQTEWNRLAKASRSTITRLDKDSGWYTASFVVDESLRCAIKMTTLPLILGEYAYQLRAALDGLIWDAITFKQGAEPASDAKNVTRLEFPILNGKVRDFNACAFHHFPFPDKLKTWMESIQPDSAEKPEGHPDRGLAGALEDIHNLARFDRHRRLRIVAALPTELYANIVFDPPEGFKAVGWEGIPCNILGDEYDLLRFKVESVTGNPPRKIRIETNAKFEIFFEDLATYKDLPSGERLRNLMEAVVYVIRQFESEFAV